MVGSTGDGGAATAVARRVTITHVANRAGVSPTTVSHVLSGKRVVGAGTRETVLAAVRELGYRPNQIARNLRTRQSHMIAVVVPDIADPSAAVLARGLADALDEGGYGTFVCNTDGFPEREKELLEDVQDRGVDGIVLASSDATSEPHLSSADYGTPMVWVGERLDHPRCDAVVRDDEGGARDATSYLLERGYLRVAMVQGPRDCDARTAGFRAALAAVGHELPDGFLVRGDWTRAGGRLAMQRLMESPLHPDAVFCANDLMAIGALDVAQQLGLSVPDDIAVVGFGDVDAAAIVSPQLTTVDLQSYDAGRAAGDLLLGRMTGHYTAECRTVVLPCPLVVRESA